MKNVLIASTALIATASVAAADVKFSGYGRFGIGYLEDRSGDVDNFTTNAAGEVVRDGSADVDTDNTILISRFRLNIDGTAETDGGVEFQARVRLQADENDDNGEQNEAGLNGARFSVIYGGLRVDAGNVAGSFDNLDDYFGTEPGLEEFLGQYSGVDYDFLEYSSTGSGANAVFFRYTVADFNFSASYDQRTVALNGNAKDADRWDVSTSYTFNNITASLAYGRTDLADGGDESLALFTLGAELGDFYGTLLVAKDDVSDADKDGTAYGFSVAYNLGAATTLQLVYGDGSEDGDTRNVGVGAIYDLGGGATLRGGVGQVKEGQADSRIQADFGAQFNF